MSHSSSVITPWCTWNLIWSILCDLWSTLPKVSRLGIGAYSMHCGMHSVCVIVCTGGHVHLPGGLVGALNISLGYWHRFSMFMSNWYSLILKVPFKPCVEFYTPISTFCMCKGPANLNICTDTGGTVFYCACVKIGCEMNQRYFIYFDDQENV